MGVEERGAEEEESEEAGRRRVNEEKASVAAASQPTVIEANADLLSFIAKKERKCLDLREGKSAFGDRSCRVRGGSGVA